MDRVTSSVVPDLETLCSRAMYSLTTAGSGIAPLVCAMAAVALVVTVARRRCWRYFLAEEHFGFIATGSLSCLTR